MSKKKQPVEEEYSAKNIQKLDPREHIRRRPGMYIGGTNLQALHNLIYEVIDFVLESVFVGKCETIEIYLKSDQVVTIRANDQLIPDLLLAPVEDEETEKLTLDYIFAEIFHYPHRKTAYRTCASRSPLSVSFVNPLTASLSVTVCNGKIILKRSYRQGLAHGAYQKYDAKNGKPQGITITFQPDFTIFDQNEFDYDQIAARCRDIAVTLPDLTITLIDEHTTQRRQDIIRFPNGIRALVRELNKDKTTLHDMMYVKDGVPLKTYDGKEDIHVEIAMQFTESDDITIRSYINSVKLEHGGTHIEGFKHALSGYLNAHWHEVRTWEQTARGLTVVVNLLYPDYDLYYESYSVMKLMNPEAFDAVVSVLYPYLMQSNLRRIHRDWNLRSHLKA